MSRPATAYCQSDLKTFCYGYIAATGDTLIVAAALHKSPNIVCIPNGVTIGQAEKVVERFLEAHPQNLNMRASVLVVGALVDAWHCK